MWFQVYLGFDVDKEEVTGNTVWWYQQKQSNLYKKHLQVQNATRKIWLLFSHKKIDTTTLAEEIQLYSARDVGYTIPMALVQANIKDGKSWSERNKSKKEEPIQGILVDVRTDHYNQAKKIRPYMARQ